MVFKNSGFKHKFLFCFYLLSFCGLSGQVHSYIYKFDSEENLSNRVKQVIRDNVRDKNIVFIGESVHYSGSDFIAKTKLVKYLVSELGFTDIIFESDFFGLYFEHDKSNLFSLWTKSEQCQSLFDFIEKNQITIWGFDNQLHSKYSASHFTSKLKDFLNQEHIIFDDKFLKLTDIVASSYYDTRKKLTKNEVEYLHRNLAILLGQEKIKNNDLWRQILESFQSALLIYTTHYSLSKAVPIRDAQMAKNLNFIANKLSRKKIMVWLANAHMSMSDQKFMKGKTMGYQFLELYPESSYHIAVGSLNLPPRTSSQIEKNYLDSDNLIHFLPTFDENFFVDAKQIRDKYPEIADQVYDDNGIFNLNKSKTNWFQHFDALIFIANGEESIRIQSKL